MRALECSWPGRRGFFEDEQHDKHDMRTGAAADWSDLGPGDAARGACARRGAGSLCAASRAAAKARYAGKSRDAAPANPLRMVEHRSQDAVAVTF